MLTGLVCSKLDATSMNMAERMIEAQGLSESNVKGTKVFQNKELRIYVLDTELVRAHLVDEFEEELFYFMSPHSSSAGVAAFTTHNTGNWTPKADLGGAPKRISMASPVAMLAVLRSISAIPAPGVEKIYEATHHGPLLKKPSLWTELGGDAATRADKGKAAQLADALYEAIVVNREKKVECSKVVIGIGGLHYPEKFTRLALEKGYAFSHIMPKHSMLNHDGSDNLDVLEQTLTMSTEKPTAGVIEWKSLNGELRQRAQKKLNELGLETERV